MHHAFLLISLPLLHDYDIELPNFTCFGEDENTLLETTIFTCNFFLKNSNINIVLYRTTEAGEMKFETKWIYFLRNVFAIVVVVVRLSY